jgi:AcrR family transcriptional regulator
MAVGTTKVDGRKEAGERTRRRLLEATRALLAERDEDAVALRDITHSAGANVASVSYHFGSKEALCRAAIEDAIDAVVQEQIADLHALGENATVADLAAVLARPVVGAVSGPDDQARRRLRIVARVVSDPPPGLRSSIAAAAARAHAELLPHLRRVIPGVPDEELCFRVESVTSIIHRIAAGATGQAAPDYDVERLLVPVIAGALAGGAQAPAPPVSTTA